MPSRNRPGSRRPTSRNMRRRHAARQAYAAAPANYAPDYTLDSGDKLRVVVFGQDGITNSYTVDAGGNINLPLIGSVPARGAPRRALSRVIAAKPQAGLRARTVGQRRGRGLPAVLHSRRSDDARPISLRRQHDGGNGDRDCRRLRAARLEGQGAGHAQRGPQQFNGEVPLNFPLRPGDTVVVKERWF